MHVTWSEYHLARANALHGLNDKDNREALREVAEALVHAGRDRRLRLEALRLRGHLLWILGRGREAITSYRAALKMGPDDSETLWNLGQTCIEEGQPKQALRYLDRLLRTFEVQDALDQIELSSMTSVTAKTLNQLGRHFAALGVLNAGLRRCRHPVMQESLLRLRNETRRMMQISASRPNRPSPQDGMISSITNRLA
jgi:tetratricopeptide (TPR) repeat protein